MGKRQVATLEMKRPIWRRLIVGVAGGTVLLVGVAMMVLPGPAIVVVPAGLAILATEFPWARRWIDKATSRLRSKAPSPPKRTDTSRKP